MPVRLPAEWEPQSAVMLTWPHADSDWGPSLPAVQAAMACIGSAICADQLLLSVCQSSAHAAHVRLLLRVAGADAARQCFATAPSNDAWARDHGPLITLATQGPVINDFGFNGWGGKFAAELDSAITARLYGQGLFGNATLRSPGLVLEGGAVETDGLGTLLATRSALVDDRRNPGLTVTALEYELGAHLGLSRFLWLDHGALSGDDTDGHIDTLARFADPQTILYTTAPAGHPDHAELQAMAAQLRGFRAANGLPYRLIPLPCPGLHPDEDGRLLPASYANFLITNHSVLLPTYGVAADRQAIACLVKVFPHRRIVPIDCRAIIRQNGSLHCLTMQFPTSLTVCDRGGQSTI